MGLGIEKNVLLAVGFLLSIGYLVVLLAVVYAVAHAPERRGVAGSRS
jgi:hypothetical protein